MKLFGRNRKKKGGAPVCIYGPPEMFDGYRPENDEPVDIYGPPEMLGALTPEEHDEDTPDYREDDKT